MKDDFMYVLENYPNADLSNKKDREMISEALSNILCEHHIVSYTNWEAAKKDPKMLNWIEQCKTRDDNFKTEETIEKGL